LGWPLHTRFWDDRSVNGLPGFSSATEEGEHGRLKVVRVIWWSGEKLMPRLPPKTHATLQQIQVAQ
jgi:hypothetical protein